MDIFLIANYTKEKTPEVVGKITSILDINNVNYRIGDETFRHDVLISVGGDGTYIKSAAIAVEHSSLLVGVNTGNVGYLCCINECDLEEKLMKIITSDHVSKHSVLLCARMNDMVYTDIVNDIVFTSAGTLNHFCIDSDCLPTKSVRASGIIISTPTGSTAYNKSAGGAVIDRSLEVFQITPLCPQNDCRNPVIIGADENMVISSSEDMFMTTDGTEKILIPKNTPVTVTKSPQNLTYIEV